MSRDPFLVARLHGLPQCGRHVVRDGKDQAHPWLGCTACCEIVEKFVEEYMVEKRSGGESK